MVYAPALEKGLVSPDTLILDEEINYGGYSPKNVGGKYYGYVSVKESICDSLNVPAVKTLDYVGIENAKLVLVLAGFVKSIVVVSCEIPHGSNRLGIKNRSLAA